MPERTPSTTSSDRTPGGGKLAPHGTIDPEYAGSESGDECDCDDCDCPVCYPGCC